VRSTPRANRQSVLGFQLEKARQLYSRQKEMKSQATVAWEVMNTAITRLLWIDLCGATIHNLWQFTRRAKLSAGKCVDVGTQ